MLKVLFNPKKAVRHPLEFIIIGIFYSSLSILISYLIFPEYSSLLMIFFTTISCLYVIQSAIKIEEKKEVDTISEKNLLKKHSKILKLILSLFIGFVISFALWSFILPETQTMILFDLQNKIIGGMQTTKITGELINNTGALKIIISNNLKVLFISFIISLFYAAGSIFILAWNASIMGIVIGSIAKQSQSILTLPVVFIKYFLHGIPEMLSYITIILAGSILFISFFRKDIFRQGMRKTLTIDLITLIIISIALILIAALIEVFISSLI